MKTELVELRNRSEHWLYTHLAKPIFFAQNPEWVHDRVSGFARSFANTALTDALFSYQNRRLQQHLAGITFPNPIGLAAGFDKNAYLTQVLPRVGFGFMEVGSITARPCTGNPGSHLKRLPQSKALLVNYGLKNEGSERIASRLKDRTFPIPLGISIAPTNDESTSNYQDAITDYLLSYRQFAEIGAYTTLNLSCPNTKSDQPFLEAARLAELLIELQQVPTAKPIFIKISPDLPREQLDRLLLVAERHGVQGIICTNLTKNRSNPNLREKELPAQGGISGKVVESLSDQIIAYINAHFRGRFIIIGCGGVFSAEDAYRKISLGASLIQLLTGMVYEGPQLISSINLGLLKYLKRDGFGTIAEAVGHAV